MVFSMPFPLTYKKGPRTAHRVHQLRSSSSTLCSHALLLLRVLSFCATWWSLGRLRLLLRLLLLLLLLAVMLVVADVAFVVGVGVVVGVVSVVQKPGPGAENWLPRPELHF